MARGKKAKKQKAVDVAQNESPDSIVSSKKSETKSSRRFYWYDYIVVGLFFVVFCVIQQWFAAWFIGAEDGITRGNVEVEAINFIYGTMWKCFLIVLLLVWLYDYFYHETEQDTA